MNENITKRMMWRHINKKLKGKIHHYHVFAVLNILFDEMIKDLKNGNTIKIHNFGTLMLKILPPRGYHSLATGKTEQSKSNKILRFELFPDLRNKIINLLDNNATFNGCNEKEK